MGGSAAQEFVGEGFALAILEGKTRQEHPVEKALEQGRYATPPDRINQCQLFGPQDIGLGVTQVGFQRLDLLIAFAQHRVKIHAAQKQLTHFMPGAHCRLCVTLGKGGAEAVAGRMPEYHQYSFTHHRGP
ncbi:hypothetical protein D9M69_506900 [compost metagenome]